VVSLSVSSEEAFAAATAEEAIAQATAAHPADEGSFVQYIPLAKLARVLSNRAVSTRLSFRIRAFRAPKKKADWNANSRCEPNRNCVVQALDEDTYYTKNSNTSSIDLYARLAQSSNYYYTPNNQISSRALVVQFVEATASARLST